MFCEMFFPIAQASFAFIICPLIGGFLCRNRIKKSYLINEKTCQVFWRLFRSEKFVDYSRKSRTSSAPTFANWFSVNIWTISRWMCSDISVHIRFIFIQFSLHFPAQALLLTLRPQHLIGNNPFKTGFLGRFEFSVYVLLRCCGQSDLKINSAKVFVIWYQKEVWRIEIWRKFRKNSSRRKVWKQFLSPFPMTKLKNIFVVWCWEKLYWKFYWNGFCQCLW